MSIEVDLKKDGIIVVSKIEENIRKELIESIAIRMGVSLSSYGFTYSDIQNRLAQISMYWAKMPEGMSEANYLYKNESIYFKRGTPIETLKKVSIHEFIHNFQEVKDEKNRLLRLGLCNLSGFKIHGLALNEAAVQYITSHIFNEKSELVKYYGIEFPTTSQLFYPLLCNLISQMSYITGERILFFSTLYGNNNFTETFINLCGKNAYYTIEKNFDTIFYTEEKIIYATIQLQNTDKNAKKLNKKIDEYKEIVKNTFLETQKLIFTSYFDSAYQKLNTVEEVSAYRSKLYYYKDLLGMANEDQYFNQYYLNMMYNLDIKTEEIENCKYLIPVKTNIIQVLFNKTKKLFKKNELEETSIKNK